MAWYNFGFGKKDTEEKLNPIQPYYEKTTEPSKEYTYSYERAYEDLEIVNRGVNILVDDCAEIDAVVHEQMPIQGVVKGIKGSRIAKLLNQEHPEEQQHLSYSTHGQQMQHTKH